jgi:hypothetical protein
MIVRRFAKEALESLEADRAAIPRKRDEVLHALLARDYEVPRAREFAAHGVSRRLKTMMLCIEYDFVILPPNREAHPSMDEPTHAVGLDPGLHFQCLPEDKIKRLG